MSVRTRPRSAGTGARRWARIGASTSAVEGPLRGDLWEQLLRQLAERRDSRAGLGDPSRTSNHDLRVAGLGRHLAPRLEQLSAWRRSPRDPAFGSGEAGSRESQGSRAGQAQQVLEDLRERRFREALDVLREAAWRHAQARTSDVDAQWAGDPGATQVEQGAWAVLAAEAREGRAVPQPPGMGEAPAEVLARLVLAEGRASDQRGERAELWRARLAWLHGDRDRAWGLLAPREPNADGPIQGPAIPGDPDALRQAVQWWLESGRPGRALDVLESAGEVLHAAPDLSHWMALCLALLGRAREAREWSGQWAGKCFPWDSARARAWRAHCTWATALWPVPSEGSGNSGRPGGWRGSTARSVGVERRTTTCVGVEHRTTIGPLATASMLDLEALRRRWGAACVAVLAWSTAGEFDSWGAACARGVLGRWEAWRRALELDGPHGGADQRRALRESRCLRWHAAGDETLKHSAIGARSAATHPIRDERGEPVAVLHVECEHHLLPTDRELEQVARCWTAVHRSRGAVAARGISGAELSGGPQGTLEAPIADSGSGADRAREDWVRAAVERLPFKLGRRRWAWLEPNALAHRPRWSVVAWGGRAAASIPPEASDSRAIERAARWAAPVGWRADGEHLGLWRDTRCGRVWPLIEGGRVVALLALESERVDDLGAEVESRVQGALEFLGAGWSFQCFMRDVRRAGGPMLDPWYLFDVDPPPGTTELFDSQGVARRMAEWSTQSQDPRPLLLVGEPGVGARAVAAWMDWRARRGYGATHAGERSLREGRDSLRGGGDSLRGGGDSPCGEAESLREGLDLPREGRGSSRAGAARWIEPTLGWGSNVDAAVRELVHQLQRSSAPAPGRARLRLSCWRDARDAEAHPDLAPAVEAAARLWPGPCLALRSLRERRTQLRGLANTLWRRRWEAHRTREQIAGAGTARMPSADVALADVTVQGLWRQSWPTQAAGLGAFLDACGAQACALRFEPDDPDELPVELMRREFRRLGWAWTAKVPARHPRPSWLTAAVESTRLANGRVNLRSAAGLLGWDRQTFSRRWREGPGRGEAGPNASFEASFESHEP